MEGRLDLLVNPAESYRLGLAQSGHTDAFRLIHGEADGWPGWHVDRLGTFLLASSPESLDDESKTRLIQFARDHSLEGVYFKASRKQVRQSDPSDAGPVWVWGSRAPEKFEVRENGVRYGLSFQEGYSCGLFLDQRENRRRLLERHAEEAGAPETLNLFAYTCAFSVCAAKGGACATSVDLSKKYLDWGRENFERNGIDPSRHDFIYGDAVSWLKRLGRKGRRYRTIILDPPTFSKSKEGRSRLFKVDRDLETLIELAVPLLAPQGELLACSNMAAWRRRSFLNHVRESIRRSGRRMLEETFIGLPEDFPRSASEPGYLKTVWIQVD